MDRAYRLDQLIDGAEELLTNLADAHNPAIEDLRNRVDQAILDARSAIAQRGDNAGVQLRDLRRSIGDYVRDYPWLAFVTGVLAAGTVGFIAGAASSATRYGRSSA